MSINKIPQLGKTGYRTALVYCAIQEEEEEEEEEEVTLMGNNYNSIILEEKIYT
jgi:hypothetical protein